MWHKLKAETFFRNTSNEFFTYVQLLSLTQILSFVVFHLKRIIHSYVSAARRSSEDSH